MPTSHVGLCIHLDKTNCMRPPPHGKQALCPKRFHKALGRLVFRIHFAQALGERSQPGGLVFYESFGDSLCTLGELYIPMRMRNDNIWKLELEQNLEMFESGVRVPFFQLGYIISLRSFRGLHDLQPCAESPSVATCQAVHQLRKTNLNPFPETKLL